MYDNDIYGDHTNYLLISREHSLPIPRGAPTLNHIGAQQLSLVNWVLVNYRGFCIGKMLNDDDGNLPSGQVALTSLHWGSVRSSKAEEKSFNLYTILVAILIIIVIMNSTIFIIITLL